MALLFVEEHQYSTDHELANGTIEEGDLVTREVGGGCHPTDASADETIDAMVVHLSEGDHIAEHQYDYRPLGNFTYDGDGTIANSDMVPLARIEQGAIFNPLTMEDDTQPAPSIERNNIVGVPAIAGEEGRIVQEGYAHDPDGDGVDTVYDRSNGNFLPLGKAKVAEEEVVTDFGERVSVRCDVRL